ncbi:CIC11C00000001021 [Sungouiella intermedia]|uniref:CIC11C00000001021 n=1 Tax=Sungouiella intermedia TaxID=45354 RepID=A0A1L0DPL8_9ASCO|nr:CIC11C00000001021 [[Candida] intermedia]
MKDVSSAVHRTINNYQLTSQSKLLKRLNQKNEARIVANLHKRHQDRHLMELIQKRDYYTNKIHELLNGAGEQPNPALIVDDYEADYYLAKRFVKVPENVDQVRAIIAKHKQFQDEMAEEHTRILREYELKGLKLNGLAKLKAHNASSEAKRENGRNLALDGLYQRIATRQRKLSEESEAMLRELKVPFFCIDESISMDVESLLKNKKYVLNTLYKLVQSQR